VGAVGRLLGDPATTFLIVTSPEPTPVEEAIFLRRRLGEAGMPVGALIVNRVRPLARTRPAIDESSLAADFGGDADLAARSMQALADLRALARRDAASIRRLSSTPGAGRPILVPQMDLEAWGAAGLLGVQRFLFASPQERAALLAEEAF
jgi:hypothetical protein